MSSSGFKNQSLKSDTETKDFLYSCFYFCSNLFRKFGNSTQQSLTHSRFCGNDEESVLGSYYTDGYEGGKKLPHPQSATRPDDWRVWKRTNDKCVSNSNLEPDMFYIVINGGYAQSRHINITST